MNLIFALHQYAGTKISYSINLYGYNGVQVMKVTNKSMIALQKGFRRVGGQREDCIHSPIYLKFCGREFIHFADAFCFKAQYSNGCYVHNTKWLFFLRTRTKFCQLMRQPYSSCYFLSTLLLIVDWKENGDAEIPGAEHANIL